MRVCCLYGLIGVSRCRLVNFFRFSLPLLSHQFDLSSFHLARHLGLFKTSSSSYATDFSYSQLPRRASSALSSFFSLHLQRESPLPHLLPSPSFNVNQATMILYQCMAFVRLFHPFDRKAFLSLVSFAGGPLSFQGRTTGEGA